MSPRYEEVDQSGTEAPETSLGPFFCITPWLYNWEDSEDNSLAPRHLLQSPLCLSLGLLWTCLQNSIVPGPCRRARPRCSIAAAHPIPILLRKRVEPPAAVPDGPGPSPVLPLTHT